MKNRLNVKVRSILLSIVCIAFLLSCDKDDDDSSNDMDFQYPLKVGNSWKYDYVVSFDYDSIAESNGYTDQIYYYLETLDIISYEKMFQDSIPVYNFYTTEDDGEQQISGNHYYNVSGDSLIQFGYYHAGAGISPKLSKKNYIFAGKTFQDPKDIIRWINYGFSNQTYLKEDSTYYDPVTVYKYPFELDNEWVYRQSYPWRMIKKVSDLEKVITQAGGFDCWKVETFYPDFQDVDFSYFDHISEIGLVKRTWEDAPGTVTDEYGTPMGTFTFKWEKTLIKYDLDDVTSGSDNHAPRCNITNPPDNIKYNIGTPLTVRTYTYDVDDNIKDMKFYIDGVLIGTDEEYPYLLNIPTDTYFEGNHLINVIVEDDYGKTFEDSISIYLTAAEFNENLYYGGLMAMCQNFLPYLVDSDWIDASEIYNYDYFSNRDNWEYPQLDSLAVTDMLYLSFSDPWNGTCININGSPLQFIHYLPEVQSEEYFELVGKYHQFSCGWDDFQGYERDTNNHVLMDSLIIEDANGNSVLVTIPSLIGPVFDY